MSGKTPVRLQLSRRKGYDLQALSLATNGLPAVNVARPSRYGNPVTCQRPYGCPHHPDFERWAWTYDDGTIDPFRCCVDAFRHYAETGIAGLPTQLGTLNMGCEAMAGYPSRTKLVAGLAYLAGKNLACWCALDGRPCHADILLEISNATQT